MTQRRLSRDDWVALGLAELSAKGPEAVKLEAICKAAGLTRGSFYHHFEDHEAFLTSLARNWFDTQTTDVADLLDPDAPASERSAALTEAAMQIDYRLELGIRELGRRIAGIDAIIREADAIRLAIVADLYRLRYGLNDEMADAFAYIEYAAFSGIVLLDPDMPPARQRALAALYDRTIARALETGAGE